MKMKKTVLALMLFASSGQLSFASNCEYNADPQNQQVLGEDRDVSFADSVTTSHSGTFHGKKIKYKATAGRSPLYSEGGCVEAQVFNVAYIQDNDDKQSRPLTFLTNGGPGAATAWLHVGGIGPQKIRMNADGSTPPPPSRMVDNPDSILDQTDLVFIDGLGTGYSRVAGPEAKKKLYEFRGDLDAYARFIENYLIENNRLGSPIYLYGESYGSLRVAGLSDLLVRRGVPVKGVILLSSALDYMTLEPTLINNLPYALVLPSFATTAAFHNKVPAELASDPDKLRAEVEKWALDVYLPAVSKGSLLKGQEKETVISGLQKYTGLSREILITSNLRVDVQTFMKHLLGDEGLITGRTDGRLTGPQPLDKVEEPWYDPSMGTMTPAFNSATNQYLHNFLNYKLPIPYRMYSRDVASEFYKTSNYNTLQTLSGLQSAVVKNPDFKVLAAQGLYDMAAPYMSVDYALDQMLLPEDLQKNITKIRLEGGHMAYADATGIKQLNDATVKFFKESLATSK